jgi:hypothetical protein
MTVGAKQLSALSAKAQKMETATAEERRAKYEKIQKEFADVKDYVERNIL